MRLDFPEATFDLFEPLLEYCPAFGDRMELRLIGPRFRKHAVALGAKCGRAQMQVCTEDFSGSTALPVSGPVPGFKSVEVEMRTVDHLVESGEAPVPQVIKIDTQGCELEVLKGAQRTLPGVSVLVLECWLVRDYGPRTPLFLELAGYLRRFDFHLWDFADQWRNAEGVLVTQDCVFLNARCNISRLAGEPRHCSVPEGAPASAAEFTGRTRAHAPALARLFQSFARRTGG